MTTFTSLGLFRDLSAAPGGDAGVTARTDRGQGIENDQFIKLMTDDIPSRQAHDPVQPGPISGALPRQMGDAQLDSPLSDRPGENAAPSPLWLARWGVGGVADTLAASDGPDGKTSDTSGPSYKAMVGDVMDDPDDSMLGFPSNGGSETMPPPETLQPGLVLFGTGGQGSITPLRDPAFSTERQIYLGPPPADSGDPDHRADAGAVVPVPPFELSRAGATGANSMTNIAVMPILPGAIRPAPPAQADVVARASGSSDQGVSRSFVAPPIRGASEYLQNPRVADTTASAVSPTGIPDAATAESGRATTPLPPAFGLQTSLDATVDAAESPVDDAFIGHPSANFRRATMENATVLDTAAKSLWPDSVRRLGTGFFLQPGGADTSGQRLVPMAIEPEDRAPLPIGPHRIGTGGDIAMPGNVATVCFSAGVPTMASTRPSGAGADPALASQHMVTTDLSQPVISGTGFHIQSTPFLSGATGGLGPHMPVSTLPAQLSELAQSRVAGPVDLALAPEELGRLRVQMVADGDILRVTLLAERPETLDLLRRNTDQFAADLRQQGFSGATFSFGQWGDAPPKSGLVSPDKADAPRPTPDMISEVITPPPLSVRTGGLDLRL